MIRCLNKLYQWRMLASFTHELCDALGLRQLSSVQGSLKDFMNKLHTDQLRCLIENQCDGNWSIFCLHIIMG
uniref:Uncharacterized protein n=1 Tax=Rhizophora mucronata TaxID=61149 RepID=A0A2P2QI75_RHIMU